VMVIIVYIFLRQELFNSRFLVLGGWFFAVLFVFLGRILVRYLQVFFVSKRDFGIHKVMIIGNDQSALSIVDNIKNNPSSGYRMVKHLLNPEIEEIRSSVGNPGVDEVILANHSYPADKIVELIDFCNENHLIFKFVPNLSQTMTANYEVDVINGMPLIELKRTALDGWGKVIKRVLDVFAGVLGLVVFSPLLGVIAFAIKWETEGPVFARLKRVSKNKEFNLLKFRGMIKNAEELKPHLAVFNERQDGPLFKIKNDPRVTGVGRLIRRYRFDEIPQCWNILRGDMSLVGPRPHQPDEIERYEKHHKRVLAIKAGATGLAQVSGSSDLPFDQEVTVDTFYIENWSLFLDFKIILRTILKVFTDHSTV
ncbi:MAG: sugar transferase, partial [Candidatus Levybacteria bacterium]|nr:sugar transferase [Candidatus Levybacteria bacterium]